MDRPLSTAEVTRLLGLDERRVREWVRSGLCQPARGDDATRSRSGSRGAARQRADAHVPAARIRRAISALARELRGSSPGPAYLADGRDVAVGAAGHAGSPTGQTLFEFEVDTLAEARRAEARRRGAPRRLRPGRRSAGVRGRARARRARRDRRGERVPPCARTDPTLTDACVNLGRLRHERRCARKFASISPGARAEPRRPVLHFNLALALQDTRGPAAAISHYERARSRSTPTSLMRTGAWRGCTGSSAAAPTPLRHYPTQAARRDLTAPRGRALRAHPPGFAKPSIGACAIRRLVAEEQDAPVVLGEDSAASGGPARARRVCCPPALRPRQAEARRAKGSIQRGCRSPSTWRAERARLRCDSREPPQGTRSRSARQGNDRRRDVWPAPSGCRPSTGSPGAGRSAPGALAHVSRSTSL
jgi:hypothetical protein